MLYKNMDCVDVLTGNVEFEVSVDFVEGMYNSVSCKKSRNRNDEEIVKECVEILDMISEWKVKNGCVKNVGKRGKYDDVDITKMSDEDLSKMYESLASRRCYYRKNNVKKYEEINRRYDEVKEERKRRGIKKMMESLK